MEETEESIHVLSIL